MLDGRDAPSTDFCFELSPELVKLLCDRRFGVGGDGLILALPPNAGGELRMRIFNADGTEPEMCGNGIRCLARFLADSDGDEPGRQWQIDTLAGRIVPELLSDGTIRVDMGAPFLQPAAIPTTLEIGPSGIPEGLIEAAGESFQVGAAGMGNPHMVIPVADVEQVDLERFGAALELHPSFPAKTNVHFVQALSPSHLVMRVWERGAGPTLACGTGACATLVVCHRLGIAGRRARLDLPGGPLEIHWDEASVHLFMDGPRVYTRAVREMLRMLDRAAAASGASMADLMHVIPHQANGRIISSIQARSGLPMDRFVVNVERWGNTSSSTIPIALAEHLPSGPTGLGGLVAFGAGLTSGAAIVEFPKQP